MGKILLISNMYPSKKYKHYGVFVQNTASILKNNGYQVDVSALKKKDSKLGKLGGYLSFYIKSIFLCLFHHYDYLFLRLYQDLHSSLTTIQSPTKSTLFTPDKQHFMSLKMAFLKITIA